MNTKLKILYVITKSNYGGAQKYVFEMALAAKQAGHNVSVACGGTGLARAETGLLVTKLEQADISVHTINNFMRDMSPLNDLRAFFEILKLVKDERPDVLHLNSSKAGGIGALAGRLVSAPKIIFTSHGLTIDEVWRPLWQRILIYVSTWFTLSLSHNSIMVSTETYTRAKKMPGMSKRIELIMNGISPIDFLSRTAAREKLAPQVPQEEFWIGGIGELHPNKNWAVAVSAMTSLPEHTHLLIIGAGEEKSNLEKLIADKNLSKRVHLLGYVDGAQYLKALDIFILPSKKEGLPYVLLEAGLAGLATIGSNLPGNQDIIKNNHNGILIEQNPDLITTAVKSLLDNNNLRLKLGQNLKTTVQTKFSINRMFNQTLALYESKTSSV